MRHLFIAAFAAFVLAGCKSPTQPGSSVEDEINAARPITNVVVYHTGVSYPVQQFSFPGFISNVYANGGYLVIKLTSGEVDSYSLATTLRVVVTGHSVMLYY